MGQLDQTLAEVSPQKIFILPPFTSSRHLSKKLQQAYPGHSLQEISLKVALRHLSPGTFVGASFLLDFFTAKHPHPFRNYLNQMATPRIVLEHDHSWQLFGFNFDSRVRINTLILEVGQNETPLVKFFKCPEIKQDSQRAEVLSDLNRLLKQGGGTTRYGFVLREGIPEDSAWRFDLLHPERQQRISDMEHYGDVTTLGAVADILLGLNMTNNSNLLVDGVFPEGVPIIEGRDIKADGGFNLEPRYKMLNGPSDKFLLPDDICMRSIVGPNPQRLFVAGIREELLPRVASHSVIIIRPKKDAIIDREFLVNYLRSKRAAQLIREQGLSVQINPSELAKLPIPLPDDTLLAAMRSLREAVTSFDRWKTEADQATSTLFEFNSAKDARLHVLATGRKVRQRQNAARLVDDFDYRVRTQFPHPLAFRWRVAKYALPNLEGYVQLLECAEVAVCYLAVVATLLAKSVGVEIKKIHEMAKRLTQRESGTNMGDWVAVIREVRDSKQFKHLPESVPFYETLHVLDSSSTDDCLQQLTTRRNDQAHGRGPKDQEIPIAYKKAMAHMETFFPALDFLSEYPLRFVERTKRDSLQKVTHYEYKDLMGDHPLVPLGEAITDDPEIEAQSLYLVDRSNKLHLARPLLTRRQCPQCGNWATFYLDRYDRAKSSCFLKSMEHTHESLSVEDRSSVQAFKGVGWL